MIEQTETLVSESSRLELDSIQSRLLIESARAQELAQKYINELYLRIKTLEEEAKKLSKKEVLKRTEIKKLQQEASTAKTNSESSHEKAMETLVATFKITPPWEASVDYKDGIPVALLLKQR